MEYKFHRNILWKIEFHIGTNLWKLNFPSIHLRRIRKHIFPRNLWKTKKYFMESQFPVEFGLPGVDEFSPRSNHETFRG